ncbi:MAG: phosphoribosylglycinamide formyltransferase [Campylobacterales bacterium]
MTEFRVAILLSGTGSNAENLIKKLQNRELNSKKLSFVVAISNKKDAEGLKKCRALGVESIVLESQSRTREEFDRALVDKLLGYKTDLVLLAGFMRILTPLFVDSFRALNIHPSLLPLFKGGNAMMESYESMMKVAGVTVHEVSKELDSGKIVAQDVLYKKENESFEEFKARMHSLEHSLYPQAVLEYIHSL